jgi:hypothetical protein
MDGGEDVDEIGVDEDDNDVGDDDGDTEEVGVAVVEVKVDGITDVEGEGVAVVVDALCVDLGEVEPPKVHTPFVPSGI